MNSLSEKQKIICKKYSASYEICDLNLKVGVSLGVKNNERPIHGMRVKAENGTSGWYIWTGEWSDESDFFVPLHGVHLHDWADLVLPYLGLPEGWRFLVSEGYEDVWQDLSILEN